MLNRKEYSIDAWFYYKITCWKTNQIPELSYSATEIATVILGNCELSYTHANLSEQSAGYLLTFAANRMRHYRLIRIHLD